ncbi:MAG TPA: AraC family transcriptional regulator [Prolixibacteraceae bacterium]|nr:AraC family transcriptional regulator [Prolixibacteraceae bacterium]HCU59815.1 AraC family transcriptional regulator [Prolixibacteraceae bacterium]
MIQILASKIQNNLFLFRKINKKKSFAPMIGKCSINLYFVANNRKTMLEEIPVYELPFPEKEKLAFKIYRVNGRKIREESFPHDTNLPHKHNYFELCIFTNGTGQHEIDFMNYIIETPGIHLLHPGQVHLIRRGENYEGYLFVFSKEFYHLHFKGLEIIPGYPLVTQLSNGPILNMSPEEFTDFSILISSVEKEFEQALPESEEIIISFLNIFFLRLRSRFMALLKKENPVSHPSGNLVYLFNQLVENHYKEIHQIGEYAELLGESPVVLNRAVKSLTGKTPGELIVERLILEARRLLLYSDLNNKEIAFKLNYDDPSYFARIFRKKTGFTPTEFRSRMRKFYES